MHPVEFTWYKAIVLIVSALAIGVGILNIVYFNRIRLNEEKCSEISTSEATTALWLNVILIIFAILLFIWSLYRLIFSGKPEKEVFQKTHNMVVHSHQPIDASSIPSVSSVSSVSSIPSASVSVPSSPIIRTSTYTTSNLVDSDTEKALNEAQKYW